jgi:hypothetical protein
VSEQPKPWKFEPGIKDDTGIHCAHTSDGRKHACVNALAGIDDPAAFVEKAKRDAARVAELEAENAKLRTLYAAAWAESQQWRAFCGIQRGGQWKTDHVDEYGQEYENLIRPADRHDDLRREAEVDKEAHDDVG